MRHRTGLLILAIVMLALLATVSSVSAMALTHSGSLGNGFGYGMMGSQQGYRGIMGSQYNHGSMMGRYQQRPIQQETPVSGSATHLTMDIVMNHPGMQRDWPAFSPSNLVVPANSLVTITIRDYDLGDTAMPQDSPLTTTASI